MAQRGQSGGIIAVSKIDIAFDNSGVFWLYYMGEETLGHLFAAGGGRHKAVVMVPKL